MASLLHNPTFYHKTQFPFNNYIPFRNLIKSSSEKSKLRNFKCRALYVDDDDEGYLIDAPVQVGDGFSFPGGKFDDTPTKADEWFEKGKMVNTSPIHGSMEKAKEPIFGLEYGKSSQMEEDSFRWFYVEAGSPSSNSSIILTHGLPSQAYSFRKVMTTLEKNHHVIAFDWLGFGFSDKPQPNYGFDYTLNDYKASLDSFINTLGVENVTLVSQGYFAPVVVSYAKENKKKVKRLILINPPVTEQHSRIPSTLSSFSNFLLGEIFAQDPLRASDKLITSCGPYMMAEDDAMVYRRPYLTSGSSGFALTAISRRLKKEVKAAVFELRSTLSSKELELQTTIIWGMRDRWLKYDGVEEFAQSANLKVLQIPKAGHHAQEDRGEEVGNAIKSIMKY